MKKLPYEGSVEQKLDLACVKAYKAYAKKMGITKKSKIREDAFVFAWFSAVKAVVVVLKEQVVVLKEQRKAGK